MRKYLKVFIVFLLTIMLTGCGPAASRGSMADSPTSKKQESIKGESRSPSGTAEEEAGSPSGATEDESSSSSRKAEAEVGSTSGAAEVEPSSSSGTTEAEAGSPAASNPGDNGGVASEPTGNQEEGTGSEANGDDTLAEIESLPEDGTYTSKEDVALYIHLYGCLPDNFITKKEAEKLGWKGGSLEPYAPGMCIGGSRFGNYEGLLPAQEGRTYTECDIDTLGAEKRGAKRIVFSNDGLIYYTEDHYQTFELLYGEE